MRYRRMVLLLWLAMASGCGFHLRGEMPGTLQEKTLCMTGVGAGNPLYTGFAQALATAGGALTKKPAEAVALVNVVKAIHLRRPITLNAVGRANMFDLTFRVLYEVQNPKGEALTPERELNVHREYFNTQSLPLGQGLEEAQMRIEMEKEASQTLLRQVFIALRDKPPKPS